MPGASILTISAIWALASAAGIAILGALTFLGGRARPPGAVAFGLFSLLWGAEIAIGNLASVSPNHVTAEILVLLFIALLIPLPYLLVEFAAAQSQSPRKANWNRLRIAAAGLATLAGLLLVAAPQVFLVSVEAVRGGYGSNFGPLYGPLVITPFYAAFAIAFVGLYIAILRAPTARAANRVKFLLMGFAVFLSPVSTKYVVVYWVDALARGASNSILFTGLFVALACVMLAVSVHAYRTSRAAKTAIEARTFRWISLLIFATAILGLGEGLLNVNGSPLVTLVGFWRLVGTGISVYGIASMRYYDMRQRAMRGAANASGVIACAGGGVAAYSLGSTVTTSPAIPFLAAGTVVAFTLVPAVRIARRLFGTVTSSARAEDDAVYGQRIDAYRSALEASCARESLVEDADFLGALRERFSISESEDRILRHYAKSTVIVSRDRKAWEAYERLRLLGEGGGGRTWLARDRQRDRLVVLKEPLQQWQQDPTTREAVLREARMAAKVRHPNVVAVEEVVEGKGSPVIVMEYLEGGSLSDHLRARGTLPWREAVPLVVDVLRGIEAVHSAGIIHRDVKPSNILLNGDGVPKVADFGIAIPQSATKTVLDVGATARAGTLFYMAPEVRAGMTTGDKRADLYACAAVLHECLYGAPPGANAPVILRSDVPAALTAALARGLAERPEDRVASARAFADDLTRVLRA